MTVHRRRVYILPTRFGMLLAGVLVAMLVGGLNYNSNLGLAFAFLMAGTDMVAMHHCNRNLLGVEVDATTQSDAFAGREAEFAFTLHNASSVERRDVEIRCLTATGSRSVQAGSSEPMTLAVPVPARGIVRIAQFELRTCHPFGWFRAWTYVHVTLTAYVAPTPRGIRALPPAAGVGAAASGETRGDEEFAGLREYQPGMPLKHMAWKVLARGAEPAVQSYAGWGAQPEWLDWSALEGQDTEARLSQLCLWVVDSDAAQRPYGLRIPGVEILPARGAAHRIACLRALAAHGSAAA